MTQKPTRPVEVPGWPKTELAVGQITAVSINSKGQPVIFHRGTVVWDEGYFTEQVDFTTSYIFATNVSIVMVSICRSFNTTYNYQRAQQGPIAEDTVFTLDENTGAVLSSWGGGMFYMPHGLTVDQYDNVWVTDVALHQVFKVS